MSSLEKRSTKRKVAETDPVYTKIREDLKQTSNSDSFCEDVVTVIEMELSLHPTDPQKIIDEQYYSLKRNFLSLAKDWHRALFLDHTSDAARYIESEMKKFWDVPEAHNELRTIFGEENTTPHPYSLLKALYDDRLSANTMFQLARVHQKCIKERQVQLEIISEKVKVDFKEKVQDACMRGLAPRTAVDALTRLDSVHVNVSDKITNIHSTILGTHCGERATITVSDEQLQPHLFSRLRHILFHEFLHEISGKSITTDIFESESGGSAFTYRYATHRKVGLELRSGYSRRFTWLNEAITEWLATELSGHREHAEYAHNGSISYITEQKDLESLFLNGLSRTVVVDAYFENATEHTRSLEHFKSLVHEINKIRGPHAFNKLENEHTLRSVARAFASEFYELVPEDESIPTSGLDIFCVRVKIGHTDHTQVEALFTKKIAPLISDSGRILLSIEEQLQRDRDLIAKLKDTYGARFVIEVA